jgi:formate dehydrogenase maturation protein FdhE
MGQEIEEYTVQPAWDEDDDRLRVQAAEHPEMDYVGVRVVYYRPNGQFANAPPHVPADEETIEDYSNGSEQMAEVARDATRRMQLEDLEDTIEDHGVDTVKEAIAIMEEYSDGGVEGLVRDNKLEALLEREFGDSDEQ